MIKRISLPIQLLIIIAFALSAGPHLPLAAAHSLYTGSLIFKEILGFFLPAIVFSFILVGTLSFKKNAPLVIGILLTLIIISNITVSLSAYSIGRIFLPFLTDGIHADNLVAPTSIQPFYTFSLPPIIGSEKAMIASVVLGIFFSFYPIPFVENWFIKFKNVVEVILKKLFIPLLPLYVLGFLIKLVQEGTLFSLFSSYGKAFIVILMAQVLFVATAYTLAQGGKITKALQAIKNASASYLTAFATMSSTASIPVTVNVAIKNTGNRPLAHIAIPILANVHLMGDGITVPIFSLVTLSIFQGSIPSLAKFIVFVGYFCLAMLATSGVPGGGIIVIIPLLQSILGFTPEMISVITALYLLQDSFGTACNVMGDGALTIATSNILKKIMK
jgi:Na+/H+-dicarboxylate symporter